ncbi:hypothetical protein [Pseudomonas sp. CGJS7]|uniref:hypothetical protein n=1 Tax=Pseudomonas sp. CGJS7 TaxID=3109348 RepID=UPI003009DA8E
MSDDYSAQIAQIKKAATLEEIQAVARNYSAKAVGEGGILYSRPVGSVSSESIALELASKTGEPIINNTPRAQFLGDKQVEKAIRESAERIFMGKGQTLAQASQSAGDLLYGNPTAVARSATSLEGSLWGEASHEFAGSLRGDVKVIASNANIERVFGKVELPAVLDNPNVRSLGGQPTAQLKTLYATGGADAVLPKVQAQFIEAAPKGIFVAPENVGTGTVTKVSLSKEAVLSLGADATKFPPAAELTHAGLARAPTGLSAAPAASVGEAALAGEAAGVARGLRPGTLVKGAAVVGAVALAYDFVDTGHQVMKLEAQGNAAGAQSARNHFIGRNVGGIGGGIAGGFLAGAGYGLIVGSETGPGALVTGAIGGIGGGIGGAIWGEKWAQQKDIDQVFTQKDKDGNEWSRDPKQPQSPWTRVAQTEQIKATTTVGGDNGTPTYGKVRYVAGDMLANELNYKSANASYELGLSHARKPQDPYTLPSGKHDTPSLGGASDWTRDAQSHAWKREVVTDYLEHGIKVSHTETANPQRAAELDQASKLIIAESAANTPAAIAARYQVAYNQFGWKQNGEVPPAIKDAAAKTDTLQASDGDIYTRGANGEWTTPGMIYGTNQASGNIRDELNGIHQSQKAGLQELSAVAAEALAHPTLPQPMTMRGMVVGAYANAGVTRTPEQIDAATAAVAQTHKSNGLDHGGRPYSLTLQPDPKTGRPGPGSAIVTMMDDGRDGLLSESKMVPKAITTAAEIKQAEKPAVDGQAPAPKTDGKNQGAVTPASGVQPKEHASNSLHQLPSADQAMFAKIRGGAPAQVSDDHVAHAMLLAKKDGITDAGKIENVKMSGDTLWVAGTTPGFKASVNVNEAVPPAQETARETLAFNQQRDRQPALDNPQRTQSQPGPSV